MIDYRVIEKSAIPPTPPARCDNYGEWLALARLLAVLAPNEAVEIDLGTMTPSAGVSSLHGAARSAGIKVSTMRIGGKLYVFRISFTEPEPPPKTWNFQCLACKKHQTGNRPGQKYCAEKTCQRVRMNRNNQNCYRGRNEQLEEGTQRTDRYGDSRAPGAPHLRREPAAD